MAENRLAVNVRVSVDGMGDIEGLNTELENLTTTSKRSEVGITDLGRSVGHLGARAFVAYDRISIASMAVENAQIRQMLAQDQLNFAIERWGVGSREATRAQQQLEISTRGVEIAQERFWVRIAFGVGIIIPDLIRGLKSTVEVLGKLHIANLVATFSTQGLTRAKLALLAATGIGIPLAIAGAVAAGLLDVGTFGGRAPTAGATNVYGNVNVAGVQSPVDFGRALAQSNAAQASRSANP